MNSRSDSGKFARFDKTAGPALVTIGQDRCGGPFDRPLAAGETRNALLARKDPERYLWRSIAVKSTFCWSCVLVVCALPCARADEAAEARKDAKKMQGSWKPVTAEIAGNPFPDSILKTMKLVLTDGKYTVTVGEGTDEGTVKLHPGQKPRAMDITGTKGPNQGKKIPAIYELTDSTLRICYDLSGKARPKEFKTTTGTRLFLVEYKRQKE